MEKRYTELESRLSGLEKDLTEARLQLESLRKEDLLEEILKTIAKLDWKDDLEVKFRKLLSSTGTVEDYSLAITYFEGLKERLASYYELQGELNKSKSNLESFIRIILSE